MQTRFWKSTISVLVALAIMLQIVPMQVFATSTGSSKKEVPVVANDPVTIVGEDATLRSETEKHFRLSDGSYIAVSYGAPVHYLDRSGKWVDIDNTLKMSSNRSAYMATNDKLATAFSANLSTGQLFASSYDGVSVSMSLLTSDQYQHLVSDSTVTLRGSSVQAFDKTVEATVLPSDKTSSEFSESSDANEATGWSAEELIPEKLHSTVLYENVYPGVDFQYTAWGYNIKEQIIVNEPQSDYCYSFFLHLMD